MRRYELWRWISFRWSFYAIHINITNELSCWFIGNDSVVLIVFFGDWMEPLLRNAHTNRLQNKWQNALPRIRNEQGLSNLMNSRWNYSHLAIILSSVRIDVFIYFQILFASSFRVELVVLFFFFCFLFFSSCRQAFLVLYRCVMILFRLIGH